MAVNVTCDAVANVTVIPSPIAAVTVTTAALPPVTVGVGVQGPSGPAGFGLPDPAALPDGLLAAVHNGVWVAVSPDDALPLHRTFLLMGA